MLLPDCPFETVTRDGSGNVDDVKAACLGEAQCLPVDAAAGVIECRFLGIPPRQDLDQTASLCEGAATEIDAEILTVTGHRHIGEVTIKREGSQHLDPVYRRALALVHRGCVAVVDIVVEALFDRNLGAMFAIAEHGDNATRCGFHDLAQHAVLDADRTIVLQEDNLVASSKASDTVGGLERKSLLDDAALDQFRACQLVQHADITAQVRKDQC